MLEEKLLPSYIATCRWFGGKARAPQKFTVAEMLRVPGAAEAARLALVRIEYRDGASDWYQLALQVAGGEDAARIVSEFPQAVVAEVDGGVLFDALYDASFRDALVGLIATGATARGETGEVAGLAGTALPRLLGGRSLPLPSRVLKVEQSNSSVIYGDGLFLKIFRKLGEGVNPDAEILRFLTERRGFAHAPPFGGELEYRAPGSEPRLLALAIGVVPNEGDAWSFVLRELAGFYSRVESAGCDDEAVRAAAGAEFFSRAAQLGQRTGEMHVALAEDATDSDFAPEPFTLADQRELADAITRSVTRVFALLRERVAALDPSLRADVERLVAAEPELSARAAALTAREITATKTRHHGDYHLGQVLNTGSDFTIIDFEGEPSRSLAERRRKRSPLRDVAGMLRSFHYAASSALPRERAELRPAAEAWARLVGEAFLDGWRGAVAGASFVPRGPADTGRLLAGFLIEKAIYEVDYELNNRPDWLAIPVRGLLGLLSPE